MHYLIDGHNLIGKMPDIELDDPNDEVKLILRLRGWAAAKRRRKVTIYFDQGLLSGKDKSLSTRQVGVVFAPSEKTADSLLIRQIKRVRNPDGFTLVTSDSAILRAAKVYKVRQIKSEQFARQLIPPEKQIEIEDSPDTAVNPQQSDAEIAEWLELFGPVLERPSSPKSSKIKKKVKPKPKKPFSFEEMKAGQSQIDKDDLEEWLRLFGDPN